MFLSYLGILLFYFLQVHSTIERGMQVIHNTFTKDTTFFSELFFIFLYVHDRMIKTKYKPHIFTHKYRRYKQVHA